jgi:hypothetical protein
MRVSRLYMREVPLPRCDHIKTICEYNSRLLEPYASIFSIDASMLKPYASTCETDTTIFDGSICDYLQVTLPSKVEQVVLDNVEKGGDGDGEDLANV